jgi:CO/xanthine dehydrogenase Mo-binding subunit
VSGVDRRRLLVGVAAVAGGGLALAWLRPDPRAARIARDGKVLEPSAYLQITPGGEIIVQVDKAELGQGIMTGFVTLVAEELEVPPARIEARLAPVHPLFQDPTQVTAESKSMRSRAQRLRETAAAARDMLLAAAAARLGVRREAVRPDGEGNMVHEPTGARLSYAELAAEAARLPVPESVRLRERAGFRYIGADVPRVDLPQKVRGTAVYGLDARPAGVLTAVIARSHEFGGRCAGYDAARALAMPGVHAVVEVPSGVAVVAESFWHAQRAAAALDCRWTAGPIAGLSTASVHDEQRRLLSTERGQRVRDDGDADAALAAAAEPVEAEYVFPYLAHAPMEPMNCTVSLSAGAAEVWAPNQAPDIVRQAVCTITGLPRERVSVHSTFCGGGFGRRALMDFVIEAVHVARQVNGPVKLAWTREDDTRHSYFRQATAHRLRAVLGPDGAPRAWSHRLVAASLSRHILPVALPALMPEWVPSGAAAAVGTGAGRLFDRVVGPFQARDGAATLPYAIPNVAVEIVNHDPGVPIGTRGSRSTRPSAAWSARWQRYRSARQA